MANNIEKTGELFKDVDMKASSTLLPEIASLQTRSSWLGETAKGLLSGLGVLGIVTASITVGWFDPLFGDDIFVPSTVVDFFPSESGSEGYTEFKEHLSAYNFCKILSCIGGITALFLGTVFFASLFYSENIVKLVKKFTDLPFYLASVLFLFGQILTLSIDLPDGLEGFDRHSVATWIKVQDFPVVNNEFGKTQYRNLIGIYFTNAQKAVNDKVELYQEEYVKSIEDGLKVVAALPEGSAEQLLAYKALERIEIAGFGTIRSPEVKQWKQSAGKDTSNIWLTISTVLGVIIFISLLVSGGMKFYLDRRLERIQKLLNK